MASVIPGLYLRSLFLIHLFNTSNKYLEKFSKPSLLRRQFIFERIFSPPSTEVAAVAICHLLDNFCHQLAAKSTSAKTKSEDVYGAWLCVCASRGPTRGARAAVDGVSVAHPSLSSACTAHAVRVRTCECASLYISVGIHAYIFPRPH